MTTDRLRDSILTATLALAAERSILAVSLLDIADRAGLTLAELRTHYASRIAILEDFAAFIDEAVLAGGAADPGEQPRERLLDILMRRFDALAPYRPGLKGLRKAAMRDPIFAATLNHIAVGAQKWTLAAARLEPTGPFATVRRLARAEALVLVVASVLPTFLDDFDEGLPKTMAALDSALQRLDRVAQVVTRAERFVDRLCSAKPKWTRREGNADGGGPGNVGSVVVEPVSPVDSGPSRTGVFLREDVVSEVSEPLVEPPAASERVPGDGASIHGEGPYGDVSI